jgi:hypothetical protein
LLADGQIAYVLHHRRMDSWTRACYLLGQAPCSTTDRLHTRWAWTWGARLRQDTACWGSVLVSNLQRLKVHMDRGGRVVRSLFGTRPHAAVPSTTGSHSTTGARQSQTYLRELSRLRLWDCLAHLAEGHEYTRGEEHHDGLEHIIGSLACTVWQKACHRGRCWPRRTQASR